MDNNNNPRGRKMGTKIVKKEGVNYGRPKKYMNPEDRHKSHLQSTRRYNERMKIRRKQITGYLNLIKKTLVENPFYIDQFQKNKIIELPPICI